jgi:hypothetical protein
MNKDAIMGARLQIGRWTGRKYDNDVSLQTVAANHAQVGSVRANKLLLPKHVFKPINTAYNAMRFTHMTYTLPWADDDTRILPATGYWKYMEVMREQKGQYDAVCDDFVIRYPELVVQAKSWLQDAYRADDYPDPAVIRSKFYVDLFIHHIPTAGDFRIDLGDDEVQRIRAQIEERHELALKQATDEIWNRVYRTVSALLESLSDPDRRFHESLLGNVSSLVNLLPTLNITDDPDLEKARTEIEATCLKLSVDGIRKDKECRADAAEKVNDLMERMQQYGAI